MEDKGAPSQAGRRPDAAIGAAGGAGRARQAVGLVSVVQWPAPPGLGGEVRKRIPAVCA